MQEYALHGWCLNSGDKMRLQSQISREYKGNKYEKFWVVIPYKLIEKLKWKSGQELEAEVKGDKLVIARGLI